MVVYQDVLWFTATGKGAIVIDTELLTYITISSLTFINIYSMKR